MHLLAFVALFPILLLTYCIAIPVIMIIQDMVCYSQRTTEIALSILIVIMSILNFNVPFVIDIQLLDISLTFEMFIALISFSGPLIGNLIFFVLLILIPVAFFVLIKTSLNFVIENPMLCIKIAGIEAVSVWCNYKFDGYVTLEFPFYGVGSAAILCYILLIRN